MLATILASGALVSAPALLAQDTTRVLAVDLTLGVGSGQGGGLRSARGTVGFGAAASYPVKRTGRGDLIVGATWYNSRTVDQGLTCLVDPQVVSTGCAANFPRLSVLSPLVGWALVSNENQAMLRVLAGPARVDASDLAASYGLLGRVDGSVMLSGALGLMIWTQRLSAPVSKGGRIGVLSGGVGLRLQ